jgi:hypothetical protein
MQRFGEVNPVSGDGNRMLPLDGGFGSENPKGGPRDEMTLMVEGVVDGGMDVEKSLRGSRRLEPLHLALSSPHDLMGVFSAIVLSEAAIMRAREAQLPESRAVGAQLVGDQQLSACAATRARDATLQICSIRTALPQLHPLRAGI